MTGPALAAAALTAPAVTAAPALGEDPLSVSIATLSPSVLPTQGRIVVTGTVINTSDETWRDINLYGLASSTPLTTPAELAAATTVAPDQPVGERITSAGRDRIDQLPPGASANYRLSIPRRAIDDLIPAEAPAGVYWFGVHALGVDSAGFDEAAIADGKARSFIVKPPDTTTDPLPVALVWPIRHGIRTAPDGTIANPEQWATDLSTGGSLRQLAALGEAAGDLAVNWLIDPAVVDTTLKLTQANPSFPVAANLPATAPQTEDPTTDEPDPDEPDPDEPGQDQPSAEDSSTPGTDAPSASLTPAPTPTTEPAEPPTPEEQRAATEAGTWLATMGETLTGDALLLLPYGDLDVAAASRFGQGLIKRAQQRSGTTLAPWGLSGTPAAGAPSGNLRAASLTELAADTVVLASDTVIGAGAAASGAAEETDQDTVPGVVDVGGRRVVLTSSAVVAGGPGPDDPTAGVAVRQRLLAEAAVRQLSGEADSLVVQFPGRWAPADPDGFFAGLDVAWLRFTSVADATGDTPAAGQGELDYPESQQGLELTKPGFDAADDLIKAAALVDRVLPRNDLIGPAGEAAALTSLAYASRNWPIAARGDVVGQVSYLRAQLDGLAVEGPNALTLSSEAGQLQAIVSNSLDQPVSVTLTATTDGQLRIDSDIELLLGAGERQVVQLEARATRLGSHNVELRLTDGAGNAVGRADVVPVRVAQVSDIIWLVMALGAALLFSAIGVRLFGRIRAARHSRRPVAPPDASQPDATPTDHTHSGHTPSDHTPSAAETSAEPPPNSEPAS